MTTKEEVNRMGIIERRWWLVVRKRDDHGELISDRQHPDGPWSPEYEQIEVVPAEQLRGAVEALEAIANWQGASGSCRDDRNGMRKKARIALDYLGGQ